MASSNLPGVTQAEQQHRPLPTTMRAVTPMAGTSGNITGALLVLLPLIHPVIMTYEQRRLNEGRDKAQ